MSKVSRETVKKVEGDREYIQVLPGFRTYDRTSGLDASTSHVAGACSLSLAVPAPISPLALKRILEMYGYKVIAEDDYNWILAMGEKDVPIVSPKIGWLVPVEILMDAIFSKAGMNLRTFVELRQRAESENEETVH